MAFDGLYLSSITKELKEKLKDSRVEKIHQPEKDEIVLAFKGKNGAYKVLLTSASDSARVHITNIQKQNPLTAPLFTMVLRKHLQSGKLLNIEQINGDRILNFYFSSTDEMGFDSEYTLSIEMMGRHSNIILIRNRDNKIMECIKHIGMDQNSYRLLLPGAEYKLPPVQNKLIPEKVTLSDLKNIEEFDYTEDIFTKLFVGISKKTSKILFNYLENLLKENKSFTKEDGILKTINDSLSSKTFFNFIENNTPIEISTLNIEKIQDNQVNQDNQDTENIVNAKNTNKNINGISYDEIKEYDSASICLEEYIHAKDKVNRVKERLIDIIKILNNNIDRINKKINILEKSIDESLERESVRLKGELLQANLYQLKDGLKEVELQNYYDDNKLIKVTLDPHKSISQNMQNYFKKYNKLKRSGEMAKEQLELAKQELEYLNSVSDSVLKSETPDDIQEIKQELVIAGYLRYKSNKKKKESPSKPMKFKSSEGITIFVGKNNWQNDFLTTKMADNNDTWLHTKGYPGSHVIIRSKEFNDQTLFEAANLAAYYSKASTGTKVPVDYTLIKYVKKPNGSKPGMVIYTTNKTIYVDPELPRVERI